MKKLKSMPSFYVIIEDINSSEFRGYNIMPYFIECYHTTNKKDRPVTIDDFKKFIERKSSYMYRSRCEYEIVLNPLVSSTPSKKIDVHYQVMMNINVITDLLIKHISNE